jgi:hypothetical protein
MARTVPRMKFPLRGGGGRRGECLLSSSFTLGSSGAIASAAGFFPSAAAGVFGVVKTAAKTGRYTFTTDRKYKSLRGVSVVITGPADTAMGNTAANAGCFRNVTTSGFDVQLFLASSGADTDGASGYVVTVTIIVEEIGGPS